MWLTLYRVDSNSPWQFVGLSDTEPTPSGLVGDFNVINIDTPGLGTITTLSNEDIAKQQLNAVAVVVRDSNNLPPIDPTRAIQLQDAAVALILNDSIPVPNVNPPAPAPASPDPSPSG